MKSAFRYLVIIAGIAIVGCEKTPECPSDVFATALQASHLESCFIRQCSMEEAKQSKADAVALREFAKTVADRCQRVGYGQLADFLEIHADKTLAGGTPWETGIDKAAREAQSWVRPPK